MTEFKVGDRVGAKPAVRKQFEASGNTSPLYGHVINVRSPSFIWVRNHLGGEWGLPSWELEYVD